MDYVPCCNICISVTGDQSVLDASDDYWTFVMEAVNGAMYLVTGHQEINAEVIQEDLKVQVVDPNLDELDHAEQYIQVTDELATITDAAGNVTITSGIPSDTITTVGADMTLEGTTLDASTIERMQVENGVTIIDPALLDKIQSMQNITVHETESVPTMVTANDGSSVSAMVTPTLDLDTLASAAAAGMNLPGDGTTQILVSKDEATGMEQVVITRGDQSSMTQEYLATDTVDSTDMTDPDYVPDNLEIKIEDTDPNQVAVKIKGKKRPKAQVGTVMREVPIKTSDVTTYKCYGCNSSYLDLSVLNRHFQRKHHGQLDATKVETSVLLNAHICFLCNAATSCMKGFQSHLERVHKVKYVRRAPKKQNMRKSNRRSRLDPGAAVAHCTLCDVKRGFLYTMNLVYHIRKYHANHPSYQVAHKAAMDLHFERSEIYFYIRFLYTVHSWFTGVSD